MCCIRCLLFPVVPNEPRIRHIPIYLLSADTVIGPNQCGIFVLEINLLEMKSGSLRNTSQSSNWFLFRCQFFILIRLWLCWLGFNWVVRVLEGWLWNDFNSNMDVGPGFCPSRNRWHCWELVCWRGSTYFSILPWRIISHTVSVSHLASLFRF